MLFTNCHLNSDTGMAFVFLRLLQGRNSNIKKIHGNWKFGLNLKEMSFKHTLKSVSMKNKNQKNKK